MDFMYEFLTFQHGNHDTNEKLEYYQNFIMILLGELKTLREAMCTSCLQNCASSKAARSGNQSFAITKDLTIGMRLSKLRHVIPTLPKINAWWRTRTPGSSSLPINEPIASVSTERNNPIFYAERDALTDTTIDVTFVHSFGHKHCVYSVCFSSDGRYMAVGTGYMDGDGSIFIYEVESHKKYCELREYASQYGSYTRTSIDSLCFSSCGRYLAVANEVGRIIIWDISNKRMRSMFHGSGPLNEVRFSPDGRLVAFRTDEGFTVLNVRDNSRRMASMGSCFDFNPGGRLIATGNHTSIMILDVRTGKAVKRWNGNGNYLRRVKFTLDGRGLLCVYNDMIEHWDVSDAVPVPVRKSNIQSDYFYQTSISPDHRLFAHANDLWDIDSGEHQYTFQGHNGFIHSVDFNAGGSYLALGSWDGFVSLWKYTCA